LTIVINKDFTGSGEISRRRSLFAVERFPFSCLRWFDGLTLLLCSPQRLRDMLTQIILKIKGKYCWKQGGKCGGEKRCH